jgi:sialic acid synthase SpsE
MKTKIIAEIGINHNGNINYGYKLIDQVKLAGAQAVKFQTYDSNSRFNKGNPFVDIFKKFNLPREDELKLWRYAKSIDLELITTPFDESSLKFCRENIELLDGVKIASFETANKALVRGVADLKLKTYFSTGQNTLSEVKNVMNILKKKTNSIIPMHCISSYPMRDDDSNLRVIEKLKKELNLEIGFSDHSEGFKIAGYAVLMGAICIEKHFTLDKKMEGPDHGFSLSPLELQGLVNHIKFIESVMGSDWMGIRDCEKKISSLAKRITN